MLLNQTKGQILYDCTKGDVRDFLVRTSVGSELSIDPDSGLNIASATGSTRIELRECPPIKIGEVIAEVVVPTTGTLGICVKTSNTGSALAAYAWCFNISATGWTLLKGANNPSSTTESTVRSGTVAFSGEVTIKVVFNTKTITCYVDGVEMVSYTMDRYAANFGYIHYRVTDTTGVFKSIQINSDSIEDPKDFNYNRLLKIKFDREVTFGQKDIRGTASAFTAVYMDKPTYSAAAIEKTVTASDVQYAVKADGTIDKTQIIVIFPREECFRACCGTLKVCFDRGKCALYGALPKDMLPSFELTITPTNLDRIKNPVPDDHIKIKNATGITINPYPITKVTYDGITDHIKIKSANSITHDITLTGTINP